MNTKQTELYAEIEKHFNSMMRTASGTQEHSHAVIDYEIALHDAVLYFGGEENTPAHFDIDMYECFHNCYKDDNGIRPRLEIDIAECRQWLENRDENEQFNALTESEVVEQYNPDVGDTFKPFAELWTMMR